jgi:hypothetical protein
MFRAAPDRLAWMRLVIVAALALVALGAVGALASPRAGNGTTIPRSEVTVLDDSTVRYCVAGFAGDAEVALRNEQAGATATIRTNNRGAGCRELTFSAACADPSTQTITAIGTGADGNPALTRASVSLPLNAARCAAAANGAASGNEDAGERVVEIAVGGVTGGALLVLGLLAARRRARVRG